VTLFVILACVFGSIAAYLGIGWGWALRDMPRAWMRAREKWSESFAHESVRTQTLTTLFLWPFVVPGRWLIPLLVGAFNRAVDRRDPRHREREIKRREQDIAGREAYVAQLEKELGIGGKP
jgi:hypothetical protein